MGWEGAARGVGKVARGMGMTVQMPMEETSRAIRSGMLIDQFGTPWLVNCGKKEYKDKPPLQTKIHSRQLQIPSVRQ